MADAPFVTCIMPTRNRHASAARAVARFEAQDYDRRELLIVDTSRRPLEVGSRHRVRVLRPARRLSVGAARNLAVDFARGDVIAHWDDDDWAAPGRISAQVAALRRSGRAVCGLRAPLYYRPQRGDAFRYEPLAGDPAYLAGATLLYSRQAWRQTPFPDLSIGEDTEFVRAQPAGSLLPLADSGWYLGIIHGGNTAPKLLTDARFRPVPSQEATERLGEDRAYYLSLRREYAARRLGYRCVPSQ